MSIYETLGLVVFCLCTLTVGTVCLWRPTAVRDYALRTSPILNPFRGLMETKSYIWTIRCCGILATFMFLLVLIGSVWGRK
jgi:hypothetical protein